MFSINLIKKIISDYSQDANVFISVHLLVDVNPTAPPVEGVVDIGEFCWCEASGGIIPPSAVQGGKDIDGNDLYVGRAYHEGALLPGKVKLGDTICYVAWGGEEHLKNDYQVEQ